MINMKPRISSLIVAVLIVGMVFSGSFVYANSVSRQVHLTITVIGNISMDLERDWLYQSLAKSDMKAEAFSTLQEHDIMVEKFERDDNTAWLFTKTE